MMASERQTNLTEEDAGHCVEMVQVRDIPILLKMLDTVYKIQMV